MYRIISYPVALTDDQVAFLKKITLPSTNKSNTVKKRAQVLLDLDQNHHNGLTRKQVAEVNRVGESTVTRIATIFATDGLDAVLKLRRSDASNHARQKLTGEDEAKIIELACGPAPEGYTRWSLSLLAEKSIGLVEHPVKRDAIGRMLKKRNTTTSN